MHNDCKTSQARSDPLDSILSGKLAGHPENTGEKKDAHETKEIDPPHHPAAKIPGGPELDAGLQGQGEHPSRDPQQKQRRPGCMDAVYRPILELEVLVRSPEGQQAQEEKDETCPVNPEIHLSL